MDSFYNSGFILKYHKDKFASGWITIVIVCFIVFLIYSSNYSYNKYLTLDGIVTKIGEEYYVSVYAKKNDIFTIYTMELIVNNKEIDYKINSISKDYILNDNKEIYKNIILEGKFDENILIENNIIKLNWSNGKTTLMNEILIFIKKGLMEWNN